MKKIKLVILILVCAIFFCGCKKNDKELLPDLVISDSIYAGVYNVSKDIKAGKYLLKCLETDYLMEIVVFENEENYDNYINSKGNTNGENISALEQYAFNVIYVSKDDSAYLNLKNENILMINYGNGKLENFDGEFGINNSGLYLGVYVVGQDIEPSRYLLTGKNMNVTVFENKTKYLDYQKSNRFTIGEEQDAKTKHSKETTYVYSDFEYSLKLEQNNILKIETTSGNINMQN